MEWLSTIRNMFLEELFRPCRVNLGLDENSKLNALNDGKKYYKRMKISETSCGQLVGTDQQKAKDIGLEGVKGQLRCTLCNHAFIYRRSMVKHMHKKHAGLFIVCKHNGHCAEIFRTEAEKSEHILEGTNKKYKLIKCEFCCLMFSKENQAKHFKKHHINENLIQCSYRTCSTRFRSEVEKQNHEALVHALTKKDKCIFCNLFFSEYTILRHYRRKHKTLFANAFKCKFHCRRYFLTEADCDEHIASAHKRPMRAEVTCLYCNKICIDKSALTYHIKRHHSAVKILCKFFGCSQYFHSQTEADEHYKQQHQKIEENKKYRCLKCNYRSAYKTSLNRHISEMHGEKILLCPKCSRYFSSSLALKDHINQTHSPRKVCPHCNKGCRHIKRHLEQEKCKRCQKVLLCLSVAKLHKKLCKL
jgi:hypothetical protein